MGVIRGLVTEWAVRSYEGRTPERGIPLPPRRLRQGGEHFSDNTDFVNRSLEDVARLRRHGAVIEGGHLVDLGAGPGRLAIALMESRGRVRYTGIEVQKRHVRWCQRHLTALDGEFRFIYVDSANGRYNPDGKDRPRWPLGDGCADSVYAYSVFSHLHAGDAEFQLCEMGRVLRPGGRAAVTGFLEPGGGEVALGTVKEWRSEGSRLSRVWYRYGFFEALANRAGLVIEEVEWGMDTDGQSFVLLRRVDT